MTKGRSAAIVALAMTALALAGIRGGTTLHGGGPLLAHVDLAHLFDSPLSTADCAGGFGLRCYSPAQIAHAYGLDRLHAAGIDGRGTTIAVVIPFGSPTIAADLHAFDQTFGVTGAPGVAAYPPIATDPQLTVIQPAGPVPPFDVDAFDGDMVFWAQETTLDVEWAHVVAPKANILLVETPVDETEGVQGLPELEKALKYVADHKLADVVSQTFGATEETFPNDKAIMGLRDGLTAASKQDITVVNASGDTGTTNFQLDGENLYEMPVNGWPSADPLVTSVGGTELSLDPTGVRLGPDVVWNDTGIFGFPAASGGGLSSVFKRPKYQDSVKSVVDGARGTPDISMSSGVDGSVWIEYSFDGGNAPFDIAGGTSAGTAQFAGIVALADQVAGQRLGAIDDALYSIPYGGGLVDVTDGNNDPGFDDVPGYDAGPGYDLASGLGTVDPPRFVPALAAAGCEGKGCGGHDDCSGTMTFAAFPNDLRVTKGASCTLVDSAVDHNIKVDDGGTLVLDGVDVGGKLDVGKKGTCSVTGDGAIVAGKVSGECAGL
jgi:subtilase family serine protease